MSPNSPVPPPKAEERESWGALRRHQLAHRLLHQRHEAVGVKSQTVELKTYHDRATSRNRLTSLAGKGIVSFT